MRKLFLLLMMAFIYCLPSMAQKTKASQPQNEYDGYVISDFRGIKWGSHVDSIYRDGVKLNFVKNNDIAGKNTYVIPEDNLMIGTVELIQLYYVFSKDNRLIGVIMKGNKKQLSEMKYIISYKFGQPELKDIPGGKQYFWVVDDIRVYFDDVNNADIFTVEFASDFETSESKKINRNVSDF